MSDFNNENNNDPIVFHAKKALGGDIIYDANGVPLFQIDDVQGSKVFDASNDGDKKPMEFEVGAEADQEISIGFDSVENSGCKEYTKKVQDVFGKNLSKDDEKAAVEEVIAANKNNLHICPPDFEEIIDSLENTDISTIGNAENAYELLMNAMHYTFSSRLINIQYLQDAEIYCYPIPTDTTTPNPEL